MAAFSQQYCRRNPQDKVKHLVEYHSKVFEELANDVIAVERRSQQLCEAHSNSATKEVVEAKRYVLKVPLQDFTEEEITVEVRHRVVYIHAFKSNPDKRYAEVRELPGNLDTREAKFTFDDGVLEVIFPTKGVLNTSCESHINYDVITVPELVILSGENRARFGE